MRGAIGRLAAAALCLAALAGCGSSSSSASATRSPGQYVSSVCGAFGPMYDQLKALEAIHLSTVAARKDAAIRMLSILQTGVESGLPKLRAAGEPDIANGRQIASATVTTFSRLQSSLATGVKQAQSLPTTSLSAFQTASETLFLRVFGSAQTAGVNLTAMRNPTLIKAAAGQPACRGLSFGG